MTKRKQASSLDHIYMPCYKCGQPTMGIEFVRVRVRTKAGGHRERIYHDSRACVPKKYWKSYQIEV